MLNSFSRLARLIENYNYYRRRGCPSKEAWQLAQLTLP